MNERVTAARIAAAIAIGSALLLAGCSSSANGSGSAPTTGSAAASPSDTGPGLTTGSPGAPTGPADTSGAGSGGAGSGGGPSAPGCTNAEIAVTAAPPPGGGAAGHTGVLLLFTNRSATACTLTGYPGVAGLDSNGSQLAQATRTLSGFLGNCGCSTPPVLILNAGDVASTIVEGNAGGDPSGDNCTDFAAMLVTAPNTTVSTQVAGSPHSCGFTVHPVIAGSAGRVPPA